MALLSISNVLYDEIKMPDHHRILDRENLLAGQGREGDLGVYGTSTALNILTQDGKVQEAIKLESDIMYESEKIRQMIFKIIEEDNAQFEKGYDEYVKKSLFNIKNLCFFNQQLVLLPFSVSKDTFNTCYPFYEQLNILHSNHKDRYEQIEIDEEEKQTKQSKNIDDFFSTFSSVKKKPKKIVYRDSCMDYIKAIKQYLNTFLYNNDYVINSFKYIPLILKGEYENELIDDLLEIVTQNKIGKICNKIFADVRKEYKTKFIFDEIVEKGLTYKIIPENFLFYRSYPSTDPPFPKRRPEVWVGFSFIDVVSYATPQDKTFEDRNLDFTSENYCELLGSVSTFKVKKQLKLLDMGSVETIKSLMEILERDNKSVLKALIDGWEITVKKGQEIINRKSKYEGDSKFADWLYENSYDGYIGYNLPGLHDECCISRDKSLEDLEEPIKGMGSKFPLQLLNSFPMKQIVPVCQEPFSKINYVISD